MKTLCGLIIILFLISFHSCSEKENLKQDSLVIAFESSPTNLDPRKATDVPSSRIGQIVYNGLIRFDKEGNIIPDLCEKWDIPDDRTYIFYLKKGVKFQNNEQLSAEDVKYTFDTIMNTNFKSPFKGSYDFLKEIRVIDNYTVEFRLKESYAPFLTT